MIKFDDILYYNPQQRCGEIGIRYMVNTQCVNEYLIICNYTSRNRLSDVYYLNIFNKNNELFIKANTFAPIYKLLELNELELPFQRSPRKISTVEASTRLDAISSAGFGLSRAKIINQIKQGKLRFNWHTTNNASRSLSIGDRLQLEGKGSLEVINLELTKRGRWRVELLKK